MTALLSSTPTSTPTVTDRGPTDVPVSSTPDIRRPVMVQRWSDLLFIHWSFPADTVQALLPSGLTVDTFDGRAHVGLIPFQMEGLGFPGLAPLPHVGAFPEVNVRTYVRAGGRRGVWFFSLDVDRHLPALAARAGYRLPYCVGDVAHHRSDTAMTTRVDRRWPRPDARATSTIHARTTDTPLDDPLVHFLTDRWRLFSPRRGGLRHASVSHQPWSIHRAELTELDDRLLAAAGLPTPTSEPHVCWSPGVDVRIGRPRNL